MLIPGSLIEAVPEESFCIPEIFSNEFLELVTAEDMIEIESFFAFGADQSDRTSANRGCKGDAFDASGCSSLGIEVLNELSPEPIEIPRGWS